MAMKKIKLSHNTHTRAHTSIALRYTLRNLYQQFNVDLGRELALCLRLCEPLFRSSKATWMLFFVSFECFFYSAAWLLFFFFAVLSSRWFHCYYTVQSDLSYDRSFFFPYCCCFCCCCCYSNHTNWQAKRKTSRVRF